MPMKSSTLRVISEHSFSKAVAAIIASGTLIRMPFRIRIALSMILESTATSANGFKSSAILSSSSSVSSGKPNSSSLAMAEYPAQFA